MERLFRDDFGTGFDVAGPEAGWVLLPCGEFPGGDGWATAGPGGLTVAPAAAHPVTGEPAFRGTVGPAEPGVDQRKWNAVINRWTPAGRLGFAAPEGTTLRGETVLSANVFGAHGHPFGGAVAAPDLDLRLGAGVFVMADAETGSVFDFFVTAKAVYAVYERLRLPGTTHAAYTYAVPVADSTPEQAHHLAITLDTTRGQVTWEREGRVVLTVDRLGRRALDRRHLLIDRGGPEDTVVPRQATFGLGLFTMLDGADSTGRGLARVAGPDARYFHPGLGEPHDTTFVDEHSLPESRLWGQGVRIHASHVEISASGR